MVSPLVLGQSISYYVSGKVVDASSNETVPYAYIHLEELHRTAITDIDGTFIIKNIPSGAYTVTVHRIGYRTQSQKVEILNIGVELLVKFNPTILSSEAIEVVGDAKSTSGSGLDHASKRVFGSDLRRNLGTTLSETLTNLPGFDQRSNGAAPGRPVIRGLGGERVLILQDGINSGDVSSQSSDHAVTIDPVSASEIEIARGPAALAYGANAIGGVINVVKNQIRASLPTRLTGTYSLNAQTVNTGIASAINLSIPYRSLAVQADLNGRYAFNTKTPIGEIGNSYYETTNDALGVSWVRPWGYAGISGSIYFSNYGIPPNPNGHPNGVDIKLRKHQYDVRSEIVLNKPFVQLVELNASFKDYNHKEIEGVTDSGREVIGTEFDLLTTSGDVRIKHNALGFINRGTFGVTSEFENYDVSGAGTPPSTGFSIGAYVIEEADFGNLHIEGGVRFDFFKASTDENGLFYPVGARIGSIDSTQYKNRTFRAFSGSLFALYNLGNGFSIGATVLRSFRPPSLEELYSEGPHLASYSFEIGNPALDAEKAWAKEFLIEYEASAINARLAFFHNGFDSYIFSRNTGSPNIQRADLLDYQFTATTARLYGFELSGEFKLTNQLVANLSAGFTIGEHNMVSTTGQTDVQPLPQIPPFKTKSSIKYIKKGFEFGTRILYSAEQARTGAFETPTKSYVLTDIFGQYRFSSKKLLHTTSLNLNNLFDETVYNHLSRIKDLKPEPGRNFTLLYRVYF